jgi:Flp pilus assembly pilin Flp
VSIVQKVKVYLREESGATAIEYSLMAGAMGLMLIPVMSSISGKTSNLFAAIKGFFEFFGL